MKRMKRAFSVLTLLLTGSLVAAASTAMPTNAAKPSQAVSTVGYDVSYPQCGSTLPKDFAFAIIGVNGGKATTENPCLTSQLQWAKSANGTVAGQPSLQLYVNTGNPGEVKDQYVTAWPSSGTAPGGATCDGSNSWACSWVYGYERAKHDAETIFAPAAAKAGVSAVTGDYIWWLDVETTNSWQEAGTPAAYANNRATLEGMTAYFTEAGATVGIYSTNYQWGVIAGTVPVESNLYTLDSWMAGARTLRGAQDNCRKLPFAAGGSVILSQYVAKGLDHNYSCL